MIQEQRSLARAAAKQADVMRMQLVGTQAAIVDFTYPRIEQSEVVIFMANRGHMTGYAAAEVRIFKRLSNGVEIPINQISIEKTAIQREGDTMSSLTRRVPLTGFNPVELKSLMHETKTQQRFIRGSWQYDNGFEPVPPQPVCYSFFSAPPLTATTGTSMGQAQAFTPC